MPAPRLPQDLPSIDYLHACFAYDPYSGVLTWRDRPRSHFATEHGQRIFSARCAGRAADHVSSGGYLCASINGQPHRVHRIAWAMHTGAWPENFIDHINGIKHDNRIANLRDVSCAVNNLGHVRNRNNTSGWTGISWSKEAGKWHAYIGVGYGRVNLGKFHSLDDAIAARKKANKEYGFSTFHGQDSQCLAVAASPGVVRRNSTSGHYGVYFDKRTGRWWASVFFEGKQQYLGRHDTKEDAIAARKAGEIKYGVADRVSYGSGPAILQDPPT